MDYGCCIHFYWRGTTAENIEVHPLTKTKKENINILCYERFNRSNFTKEPSGLA